MISQQCKRRGTRNLTTHLSAVIFIKLIVLSISLKMAATNSIEIKCLTTDSQVCEIDPAVCPELTDENTSEENVNIVNYNAAKSARTFDILTRTRLTKVPTFILKKFKKLHSLRIIDAGIVELVPESFVDGKKIELLDLRRNEITNIPANVFAAMEMLEELSLFDNKISNIEDGAFNGLGNLKQIFLAGNRLTVIGGGTFAGAENLEELFLDDNAIGSIASGAINMPHLENIVLRGNRLKSLPEDLFAASTMLEKADLSKNELMRLGGLFDQCSSLYLLNLNDNPDIEDADLFDVMQRFPGLSYLYLANTNAKLPEVAPQTNETEFALTHLNLAYNRLTNANILKLLMPFKSMKTIELQQNQLKRLELVDDIGNVFPRLTSINLQNNDLDVDWLNQAKPIFDAAGIQIFT